ncbi:hypothetical protein [Glutamicibacter sp. TV12E]|uniref:hypothetical protein n=1 Tax=Glutamicibacter sp. TV12E TaxID=3446362 RepID=UPI0040332B91
MTNLTDPITTKDVAEIMGVSARYVTTQRSRQQKRINDARANGLDDSPKPGEIPEPELVLDRKPIWERATIERWQATRPDPGRRNRKNR